MSDVSESPFEAKLQPIRAHIQKCGTQVSRETVLIETMLQLFLEEFINLKKYSIDDMYYYNYYQDIKLNSFLILINDPKKKIYQVIQIMDDNNHDPQSNTYGCLEFKRLDSNDRWTKFPIYYGPSNNRQSLVVVSTRDILTSILHIHVLETNSVGECVLIRNLHFEGELLNY